MFHAQNLDKLSQREQAVLAWMLANMSDGFLGMMPAYAIEVKLDDPITHMFEGGDGLHVHYGNGSKEYFHEWGNPEWAIVHKDDEEWKQLDWKALLDEGEKIISAMFANEKS